MFRNIGGVPVNDMHVTLSPLKATFVLCTPTFWKEKSEKKKLLGDFFSSSVLFSDNLLKHTLVYFSNWENVKTSIGTDNQYSQEPLGLKLEWKRTIKLRAQSYLTTCRPPLPPSKSGQIFLCQKMRNALNVFKKQFSLFSLYFFTIFFS